MYTFQPTGPVPVAPVLHVFGLALVGVHDRVVEEPSGSLEPIEQLACSGELVVEQHAPFAHARIRREDGDVDVGLEEHAPQVLGEVVLDHAVDAVPPVGDKPRYMSIVHRWRSTLSGRAAT